MKEVIKLIINVLLLVLYVLGLWTIGSRVGVDLLVVLWSSGMYLEAVVVGFIVWEWLIVAVLKLTHAILTVMAKAGF